MEIVINMKHYIKILLLALLFMSCKKDKYEPPNGDYIGDFYGHFVSTGIEINSLNIPIVFSEVTDTSMVANGLVLFPLEKRGDSIIGKIPTLEGKYNSAPFIKAIYAKKWKRYTISGSYRAYYETYELIEGTFEIKTDK